MYRVHSVDVDCQSRGLGCLVCGKGEDSGYDKWYRSLLQEGLERVFCISESRWYSRIVERFLNLWDKFDYI